MQLEEVLSKLKGLPPDARAQVEQDALKAVEGKVVIPNPGPQTEGYFSLADILLFGGAPGGGKSVLELALALNEHYRALLVRKSFTDLEGLIDTAIKLIGSDKDFVRGSRPKYNKPNGGVIHFAGLSADGGIGSHQGVDHDLICVDEAAQIPEKQVRLLMGWRRTDRPGQRCRMVLASNPPLDSTGDWMIDFFAPWLNPVHPNPAKPGELRWFLPTDDGKDRECEQGDWVMVDGQKVYAHSRTFIPSKYTDNPYYNAEEYAASLAVLPPQVREILMTGNFMLARQDDPWQVMPLEWIRAAQERWTDKPPANVPMCAMGVDVAQGGTDETVIAIRHDGWFAPMAVSAGSETPDGPSVAGLVIRHRRDDAHVVVDMGGGYGGSAYDHLKENIGHEYVHAYKGAAGSMKRTQDKTLSFTNKRSETYWRFREALDPSQPGGSPVMLPHDPKLVADLTAPTFQVGPRGITVIAKEKLTEKLGRSPDRGDAVVMSWTVGLKAPNIPGGWKEHGGRRKRSIQVDFGPRRRR